LGSSSASVHSLKSQKEFVINLNFTVCILFTVVLVLLHSENTAPHSLSSLPCWIDSTLMSLALLPSLVGLEGETEDRVTFCRMKVCPILQYQKIDKERKEIKLLVANPKRQHWTSISPEKINIICSTGNSCKMAPDN
jgi:hypothetical protein